MSVADLRPAAEPITTMAMDPGFQTSAEFTEYFNSEIDKWAAIIKAADVKPEQ